MRAVLMLAVAGSALISVTARAEDMVAGKDGLMCRNEKALADLTAPNGSAKPSAHQDVFSSDGKEFTANCKDLSGETVHVITKRKNTSIVTYNGETWYVPNIDFFTPGPSCVREESNVTMTGIVESAFYAQDDTNPTKGYHYPHLKLDKPVCYVGNLSDMAARYISLVGTKPGADAALMKLVGRRVTVSGSVGSPNTGSQPPDTMMIFDPVVRPAP